MGRCSIYRHLSNEFMEETSCQLISSMPADREWLHQIQQLLSTGCHEIPHRATARRAPRRNTCLGFNWISKKCGGNVEETLNTSNGANLQRSETSSYPPFASASSAVRAVYAVRAVRCFVTPLSTLSYLPDLLTAPMQININWLLWDLTLRTTDSLTASGQWKTGIRCLSPSCQLAL